jgi:hypothetical protein
MSWTITPQTKVPVDPQYGSVSLLLHGNGTNGSTTITDNSPSPKTVTTVGNAQISTAQSKFGGASIAFDGAGDWLTCPMSTGFNFGTTDLTIEGWINVPVTDSTYRCILSIGTPVQIYNYNGNIVGFFGNSEGGGLFVNPVNGPTSSLTANTWTHFAITRSGSTFKSFVNGVSGTAVTGTDAIFATLTNTPAIGIYLPTSSLPFTGYIDDLRITKGVARYTANFTPPAAPFPDI